MGPLLKATLAFWTHVGLEEGLGARSHVPCESERQRRLTVEILCKSEAGQIIGETQFSQTQYVAFPFSLQET